MVWLIVHISTFIAVFTAFPFIHALHCDGYKVTSNVLAWACVAALGLQVVRYL